MIVKEEARIALSKIGGKAYSEAVGERQDHLCGVIVGVGI
jgi:hypothetical protein